jgi:hypothetical protein
MPGPNGSVITRLPILSSTMNAASYGLTMANELPDPTDKDLTMLLEA